MNVWIWSDFSPDPVIGAGISQKLVEDDPIIYEEADAKAQRKCMQSEAWKTGRIKKKS